MWRWILFSLLVRLYTVTPQPIASENDRPMECCPCPKSVDMVADNEGAFTRPEAELQSEQFDQSTMADTARAGAFIRPGVVDDCPCRFRDADAVGAPSILFPSAVRALWPVVSDNDGGSKEDAKPLLHPEVDLASSVLETLRQATDEEYEDALARDAARNVMKAADPDVIGDVSSALDTAKNIVNVILQQGDLSDSQDGVQEATHVQETRIAHPLGRYNVARDNFKPSTNINEIFNIPMREFVINRNVLDMDSSIGASNVNENIFENTNGLKDLNIKLNRPLLDLFPDDKNVLKNNGFQIRNPNFKSLADIVEDLKSAASSEKSVGILNNNLGIPPLDLKNLKFGKPIQSTKSDDGAKIKSLFDNDPLSSVRFNHILPINQIDLTTVKPFVLKDLFNLKNVELIPPIKVNSKETKSTRTHVPILQPVTNKHYDKSFDDLFKDVKPLDNPLINIKGFKPITNIQTIPKNISPKSDLGDVDTSPSEVNVSVNKINRENCDDESNNQLDKQNSNVDSGTVQTEIIEKIPEQDGNNIKKHYLHHAFDKGNVCLVKDSATNSIKNDVEVRIPFKKIANTEILDTLPNSSEIHHSEPEDFKSVEQIAFNENAVSDESDDNDFLNEQDRTNVNEQERSQGKNEVTNRAESSKEEDCSKKAELDIDDPIVDASNAVTNIVQREEEKQSGSGTNNVSLEEHCEDSNQNAAISDNKSNGHNEVNHFKTNPLFKKTNPLSSLAENIRKRLDDFKKMNEKNVVSKDVSEISDNDLGHETRSIDECENEISDPEKEVEVTERPNSISIQDLQNMSDKLLDKSTKRDQETLASEIECPEEFRDGDIESNEIADSIDTNANVAEESTGAENFKPDISTENKENIEYNEIANSIDTNVNVPDESAGPENSKPDISTENKENTLDSEEGDSIPQTSNVIEESSTTSQIEDINETDSCLTDSMTNDKNNEMSFAASEPIINSVDLNSHFKSPNLQKILHLKPLTIGNNLKAPNFDISKVLNIPNLDDIRDNLPNIFENTKDSDDLPLEQGSINNDPIVEADTPKMKVTLPSLQHLQDVDLDIFQLNPLSLSGPNKLLEDLPRINLNSYKAKLALPKAFDLKPMKLESSLGGKNSLLGATLTIGPDKIKPFETGSILRNPLYNFPSLEELRTTMRENAQNLLATPLETTGKIMIDDTLRSGQTITDNLRSHAKNTMRNLQQTFETTLKDARESDLNLFGDSITNQNDFLEAVSRKHEDFNDKLKGIHYDLNDRLESIRDRFMDQSIFPTFPSPLMRESILEPRNSFNFKDTKIYSSTKSKPTQSKAKTGHKASSQKSGLSRSKSSKTKTFKMPASPSVTVPKTVKAPKLSKQSTFSNLKAPQLLTNKKSISEFLHEPVSTFKDSKIPILGKYKARENKVTITFGTTAQPDLLRNKQNPIFSNKSNLSKRPLKSSKLNLPDTKGAPSTITSTKIKAPIYKQEKITAIGTEISPKDRQSLNKISLGNNNERLKGTVKSVGSSKIDRERLRSFKSIEIPKNKDILTSLREAVRARLSNVNLKEIGNEKNLKSNSVDMSNAASENFETGIYPDSLKENTSYTCRMMCTKNV